LSSRLKKSATVAVAVVAVVAAFEGVRTVAYRDSIGVPTICFGETRGVHMGDRKTLEQCREMLGDALYEFEQGFRKCLVDPSKIPDGAYIAFLSLSYNIGIRGFCKSSVARYANYYSTKHKLWYLQDACRRIKLYNKAGGRTLRGLVRRRAKEYSMCMEGTRNMTITGEK